MRKMFINKELICPFNYCRIFIFTTEEDKSMDIRCENCEYVWNRNSTLMIGEEHLFLDENSKEYKEYEILHKVECVDDDYIDSERIKQSNDFILNKMLRQ